MPTMGKPIANVHFHLYVVKMSTQLPTFQQIETAVTFGTDLLLITLPLLITYSHPQVYEVEEDRRLYFTVGLHPNMADHNVSISFLLEYMIHPKCVGIGEIGFDIYQHVIVEIISPYMRRKNARSGNVNSRKSS